MKTFKLIRFHFHGPLHISTVREDYAKSEKILHSDSLYAAIMHVWGSLGWEVPPNPAFALSSLFPFTQQQQAEYVYFFPKPYFRLNVVEEQAENNENGRQKVDAKKVKKIAWVDRHFYEMYLNQKPFTPEADCYQDEFLTQTKLESSFMSSDIHARVTLDRWGKDDAKPFYMEKIYFQKGSGLYALVQFDDAETEQKVMQALDLLQDWGLGTDRTVGLGGFELQSGSMELDLPQTGAYCTNLSLFCPEDKAQLNTLLDGEQVAYEVVKRGGWISKAPFSTLKKQSLYMFREGGLFANKETRTAFVMGATKPVTPDILNNDPRYADSPKHPIYRVGKAIFLPVALTSNP